jgi:chemotaxis protein histidine kinase CheA
MITSVQPSAPSCSTESCKAIAFDSAGYLLALPLPSIFKIVLYSPSLVHSVDNGEFMYFGNQPVTLLNLQSLLARAHSSSPTPSDAATGKKRFLVIARLQAHHLCAIPVDKPPSILELVLPDVRPLPTFYPAAMRTVVSHVAVIPTATGPTTVFLLNLHQALQQMAE